MNENYEKNSLEIVLNMIEQTTVELEEYLEAEDEKNSIIARTSLNTLEDIRDKILMNICLCQEEKQEQEQINKNRRKNNYEKIKDMTIEEMAKYRVEYVLYNCFEGYFVGDDGEKHSTEEGAIQDELKWLKSAKDKCCKYHSREPWDRMRSTYRY